MGVRWSNKEEQGRPCGKKEGGANQALRENKSGPRWTQGENILGAIMATRGKERDEKL